MNQPLDTRIFDRAAEFAIKAHGGTERRGKGFPYIIHPMEAAAIAATITNDQEILAAAVLHDVVEDTEVTADELRKLFGDRVTDLVLHETGPREKGLPWRTKKQVQIDQIRMADRDSKIVAMGDKLSNMRAIASDYRRVGNNLWSRFHAPGGKEDIEWYYRGLAEALMELAGTFAYQEFITLLDQTFGSFDCSTPHLVNMDDYEESGAGFYATSYNHRDGVTMIKLYNETVDKNVALEEIRNAHNVYKMHIPCPLPGRFVTDGRRYGAEFDRIKPKMSFARLVSMHPEKADEVAHRFARLCRQLHATRCDTTLFESEKEHALAEIARYPFFNDQDRKRVCDFVRHVPDECSCLHGDMHIGNVITTAVDGQESTLGIQEDFWIDLGDFRWGNAMFDLGMFRMISVDEDEELMRNLYHLDIASLRHIWDVFICDYYDIKSASFKAEIEAMLDPFAALKMIHLNGIQPIPEALQRFVRRAFNLDKS